IHPNGKTYTWVNGLPFGRPLPAAPAELVALVGRKITPTQSAPTPNGSSDWVASALDHGAAQGSRDDTCTRLAGYLLGKGLSEDIAESILLLWAARCDPEFPSDQVFKCVRSIAQREAAGVPDTPPLAAADLVAKTIQLIKSPVKNFRKTGLD